MLTRVKEIWHHLFLEERPSRMLSVFRPFAAFTVGAHIVPTLLHLEDNYQRTAFKQKNPSFFTQEVLRWVDQSPDGGVIFMVWLFLIALALFAVGLFTQWACIAMTASCYYFYALNSLHIGTLSFDILLVTLFLLCVTRYPGDYFSLDALRSKKIRMAREKRPFFIQRLLQIQIASTYFYTGLCKFTAQGNWLSGNPIHCLVNSAPESVVKEFAFRDFFAARPGLCYAVGVAVIVGELLLPFALFARRTRLFAIAYGFLFHILLVITLHVPTIFFFLFPPQLLLFLRTAPSRGKVSEARAP